MEVMERMVLPMMIFVQNNGFFMYNMRGSLLFDTESIGLSFFCIWINYVYSELARTRTYEITLKVKSIKNGRSILFF